MIIIVPKAKGQSGTNLRPFECRLLAYMRTLSLRSSQTFPEAAASIGLVVRLAQDRLPAPQRDKLSSALSVSPSRILGL